MNTVLSTVAMDDPAVFSDFVRNNLVVTTQWTIDVITNFLGYFGELLAVNDGDIDTFVKDTHSMNNSRTDAQKNPDKKQRYSWIQILFFS